MTQCSDCLYSRAVDGAGGPARVCCRKSPEMVHYNPYAVTQPVPTWPLVHDDDWCGEYAPIAATREPGPPEPGPLPGPAP